VHDPSIEAGVDTPALLQQRLRDAFDGEYSRLNCRRLLNEPGLTYRTPRRPAGAAEINEREEFVEEFTQRGRRWMPP
jgi:transposase